MQLKSIYNRIYSDYILPSRITELRTIYETALNNGYEMHSVVSFWQLIKNNAVDHTKKYFINRHDIDTGIKTTKKIFQLEKSLGIKSSYYFRLTTLDFNLMKSIHNHGSEASYHFEEIATLAKKHNWRTSQTIDYKMAQSEFIKNFMHIKKSTNLPMTTVCSHGDFVNRKLNVVNHALLNDNLRDQLGIELETYDKNFMIYPTVKHSDTIYPKFYKPHSPMKSIKAREPVVYFLTHPRHWHKELWVNTKDNILRAWQGFFYK